MKTLEKTLDSNSLEIIKKMLLSKDARLKKKTTNLPHNKICYAISREYESAHNELFEALYFYGIIGQEEIVQ